jgi:ribosomal protein S6
MNKYELMVILDPTISETSRDEVIDSLKKEITSRKGKVTAENVW